jgi:hypothetical protein
VSVELQRKNSKFLIDNVVLFNAVARTLNISSTPAEPLIKEEDEPKAAAAKSVSKSTERQAPTFRSAEKSSKPFFNLLGVNRWLLLATILTVVASLGLYLWSDYSNGGESDSSTAVSTLDLEKPELKRYMKVARLSGNTLYAIVTTEYEGLSPDAKREYLSKVLQAGTTKGYNRVSFINAKGKDVGYASPERIETGNK